ncbi:MAG: alpha/beta fold hydrolase [Chloroflexi bacterium]|nr:alpha/beta fold hydrolase [Chloroflexota bacterium]
MKRGYADTPEGQIHYYMDGEGEPLLLLHQTGSSRQYWKLMPLLSKAYKVFALDTLGSGNSDPLPPKVEMHDLAQSAVHFMDALGIEKAHVFGFHTGNKIATEMAASWPSRIDGLILGGHTHSIFPDPKELLAVMGPMVFPRLQEYDPSPDGSHLLKQWAADFSRLAATWWDTSTFSKEKLTPELFQRRKERIIDSLQARGEAEKYRAIFAMDLGVRMRHIQAKTLVIEIRVPAEAHLSPQGAKLTKLIPNSRLATVENPAGGLAVEAKAEELAELILDFLRSVRQSKSAARA